MKLRLNLGHYLAANGLSAYRVVQESRGALAQNTVYALARKPAQRIDLETVGKVLEALGRAQHKEVVLADLIEVTVEPIHAQPGDPDQPALNVAQLKTFRRNGSPVKPSSSTDSAATVAQLRGKGGQP